MPVAVVPKNEGTNAALKHSAAHCPFGLKTPPLIVSISVAWSLTRTPAAIVLPSSGPPLQAPGLFPAVVVSTPSTV